MKKGKQLFLLAATVVLAAVLAVWLWPRPIAGCLDWDAPVTVFYRLRTQDFEDVTELTLEPGDPAFEELHTLLEQYTCRYTFWGLLGGTGMKSIERADYFNFSGHSAAGSGFSFYSSGPCNIGRTGTLGKKQAAQLAEELTALLEAHIAAQQPPLPDFYRRYILTQDPAVLQSPDNDLLLQGLEVSDGAYTTALVSEFLRRLVADPQGILAFMQTLPAETRQELLFLLCGDIAYYPDSAEKQALRVYLTQQTQSPVAQALLAAWPEP